MSRTASAHRAADDRPLVVHVSGDFPDTFEAFKTPVIRKLVDLTAHAFDHHVISINRSTPSIASTARMTLFPGTLTVSGTPFKYGTALEYSAPAKGIRHQTMLRLLGEEIVAQIKEMDRTPSLLVGHKLTIEGIAVRHAASKLGLPYALSIQGNTDTKILASRPDLKSVFADIYHGGQVVFPFAPWAQRAIEARLGERTGPTHLLPCPTDLDEPTPSQPKGNGLVSVFHLKNYKTKNLTGIAKAYRLLGRHGTAPPLEIVGGGTERELNACKAITQGITNITFAGHMDPTKLPERMACATACLMPSLRESFGLIFIEALFAGLPIIYPKGAAVDGYFDDLPFALRVDANSPKSIAAAIEDVVTKEVELKAALATWLKSPEAEAFTREQIANKFEAGLNQAIRRT